MCMYIYKCVSDCAFGQSTRLCAASTPKCTKQIDLKIELN